MSREIKFRFWDSFNACWTYSDKVADGLSGFFNLYSATLHGDNNPILMQYTGLNDKNGKEIYEGDIVNNGKEKIWNREVKYYKYGFWFIQINGAAKYPITFEGMAEKNINHQSNWEVIGNKHDNPELWK